MKRSRMDDQQGIILFLGPTERACGHHSSKIMTGVAGTLS